MSSESDRSGEYQLAIAYTSELMISYVVCNMKHSEDGGLQFVREVQADVQPSLGTPSVIPTL
jgi:hypothetical protein